MKELDDKTMGGCCEDLMHVVTSSDRKCFKQIEYHKSVVLLRLFVIKSASYTRNLVKFSQVNLKLTLLGGGDQNDFEAKNSTKKI